MLSPLEAISYNINRSGNLIQEMALLIVLDLNLQERPSMFTLLLTILIIFMLTLAIKFQSTQSIELQRTTIELRAQVQHST